MCVFCSSLSRVFPVLSGGRNLTFLTQRLLRDNIFFTLSPKYQSLLTSSISEGTKVNFDFLRNSIWPLTLNIPWQVIVTTEQNSNMCLASYSRVQQTMSNMQGVSWHFMLELPTAESVRVRPRKWEKDEKLEVNSKLYFILLLLGSGKLASL